MKNLTRTYLVALSIIAAVIIINQVLIQKSIKSNRNDSRVINLSGRQRMLSQRIMKAALTMASADSYNRFSQSKQELSRTYNMWYESHFLLQYGGGELEEKSIQNSMKIIKLFEDISLHFNVIDSNVRILLNSNNSEQMVHQINQMALDKISLHEGPFLRIMDEITFQYDKEALSRVHKLSKNEYILFVIIILLLVLESVLIFRPAIRRISADRQRLLDHENWLKKSLNDSQYYANQARSIFKNVGQPIFLIDSNHIVDSLYSQKSEVTFQQNNLRGLSLFDLLKPMLKLDDYRALVSFVKGLFDENISFEEIERLKPIYQLKIRSENKLEVKHEKRYFEISFSRIVKENEIHRVLVTLLDKTESVQLRRSRKKLKKLNKNLEKKVLKRTRKVVEQHEQIVSFAYQNSHKTRAPVARLLGLVNLLKSNENVNSPEVISHIEDSTKEIDEIVIEINHILGGNAGNVKS